MDKEEVITTFYGIDVKKLSREEIEALADYIEAERKKAKLEGYDLGIGSWAEGKKKAREIQKQLQEQLGGEDG